MGWGGNVTKIPSRYSALKPSKFHPARILHPESKNHVLVVDVCLSVLPVRSRFEVGADCWSAVRWVFGGDRLP